MFIEDALSPSYKVYTSLVTMKEGLYIHMQTSMLATYLFVHFSVIWTLKEKRGQWKANRVFMGGDDICHGGLVGEDRARYIISFGEDENGTRTC